MLFAGHIVCASTVRISCIVSMELPYSDETQKKSVKVANDRIAPTLSPDGSYDQTKPAAWRLAKGTIVGERYEIVSLLGEGGMGVIYKAKGLMLDQEYAIKMMHLHMMDEKTLLRFKQEAKAASNLRHPGLISVHDFGFTPDGHPYMVMDFVEGTSLADFLKDVTRLEVKDAVDIFLQIADAMEYAHSLGVLHRDLKPSNVMLTRLESLSPVAQVVDFGIAKVEAAAGEEPHGLTQTGEIFGSPLYMSPEQARGQKVDVRSDVYSLGCLMYETLTGVPPFKGDSVLETMLKHLDGQPAPLADKSGGKTFSESLESVVGKCLEKNQEDRYQSMRELKEDLLTLKAGEASPLSLKGSASNKPLASKKPRVSVRPLASIAVLLTSICLCGLFVYNAVRFRLDHPRLTPHLEAILSKHNVDPGTRIIYLPDCGVTDEDLEYFTGVDWAETTNLNLEHGDITNKGCESISKLKNLRELVLSRTSVNAKGLELLQKLPLKKLWLKGNVVGKGSLEAISGMSDLTMLDLEDGTIDQHGLTALQKLDDLSELNMKNTRIDGSACEVIGHLSVLRLLNLDQDPIANGVPYLKDLHLRLLCISNTGITDKEVKSIAEIKSIDDLIMENNKISSEALKDVASMPALRKLSISGTQIDDSAIQYLTDLPLVELNVNRDHITDLGAEQICKIESLTTLGLNKARISDSAVNCIARLPRLESLSLNNTPIGDQSVQTIMNTPQLRKSLRGLHIDNTKVTDQAVAEITKLHLRTLSVHGIKLSAATKQKIFAMPYLKDRFMDGGGTSSQ